MTKRTSSKGQAAEQQSPDQPNEIYLAHQVHTLAQILLQQLSSRGWSAGPYSVANAGPGWPSGTAQTVQPGWQGAAPPIVQWYP